MKALFYQATEPEKNVHGWLTSNNIPFEEWINSEGESEYRIDLENVTQDVIDKLNEYDDYSDDIESYTYLIFWFCRC